MNWISTYQWQIAMVIAVCIVLGVGRAAILPIVKSSTLALWVAFAVTAFCGLVLCWALFGVMQWVTALPSLAGAVVGSIGAIIALWAGWHAASMIVPLARDVIDKRPDEDARKAALWVPTLLPAGFDAVWGVISHPRGITSTVTGAIMAGITILYAHRIVKAALAGRAGARGWRWFATLPMLLAGIVMIPLLAFADAPHRQLCGVPDHRQDCPWLARLRADHRVDQGHEGQGAGQVGAGVPCLRDPRAGAVRATRYWGRGGPRG
jgi:hypothetical protein